MNGLSLQINRDKDNELEVFETEATLAVTSRVREYKRHSKASQRGTPKPFLLISLQLFFLLFQRQPQKAIKSRIPFYTKTKLIQLPNTELNHS